MEVKNYNFAGKTPYEVRQELEAINVENHHCHLAHCVLEDNNLDVGSIDFCLAHIAGFIVQDMESLKVRFGDDGTAFVYAALELVNSAASITNFLGALRHLGDNFLDDVYDSIYGNGMEQAIANSYGGSQWEDIEHPDDSPPNYPNGKY